MSIEWQSIAAIGFAVAFVATVALLIWLIVRGRMPGWPPRDWRAIFALVASVTGAAVLTIHRAWLVSILETAKRYTEIAHIAYGDTVIIGLVLLALGYAISQRRFSAKFMGGSFDTSGGDPLPGAPSTTVDVSVATVPAPPPASLPVEPPAYIEYPAEDGPNEKGGR